MPVNNHFASAPVQLGLGNREPVKIILLWEITGIMQSTTQLSRPCGLLSQSPLAALLAWAIFAILPAASASPAAIGASNASHEMIVNRP